MHTEVLERPKVKRSVKASNKVIRRGLPITFVHAETCAVEIVDGISVGDFVAENDTLNPLSGDSDTS